MIRLALVKPQSGESPQNKMICVFSYFHLNNIKKIEQNLHSTQLIKLFLY